MDWSNPIGSAVSGAFGLVGSGLNYVFSKRLAEQQNAYNLQMWNLNNEYNKPINQMRRYEEAGLNPALMYGSVTPGTSSAPAHQVTPEAPDFSGPMRDLAQAFNIEGLKTAIANRKKAQAEARIALNDAYVQEEQTRGLDVIAGADGRLRYNPKTGTFQYLHPDRTGEGDYLYNDSFSGVAYSTALRFLADNFRTNSLLQPRADLIATQAALNRGRNSLLAPQITMANYDAKYYPYSYWISNGRQGASILGGIGNFIGNIPKLFKRPPLRFIKR